MAILSPLLLWVALVIAGLCGVWMMVLGFKRHWAWGAAMVLPQVALGMFLFAFLRGSQPPAVVYPALSIIGGLIYLCFLIAAWSEAKQPFFWWLSSVLLFALFMLTLLKSDQPMSAHVTRVLRATGWNQELFDRIEYLRLTSPLFNRGRVGIKPPPRIVRNQQGTGTSTIAPPTPPPVFQSRLPPPSVPPGQREAPQPGIYYLLERVTTKNSKGVQHGLPGERVILLERLSGNRMKVTVGNIDFIVNKSQLTDDISVARDLEKQDFVARGGQL